MPSHHHLLTHLAIHLSLIHPSFSHPSIHQPPLHSFLHEALHLAKHLPAYSSFHGPVHPSSTHLPIHPSSIYPPTSHPSIHPSSICPSTHLPTHPSTHPPTYPLDTHLSISPFIHPAFAPFPHSPTQSQVLITECPVLCSFLRRRRHGTMNPPQGLSVSLGRASPHRAITYQNMSLCSKGHSDPEKANLCGLIRGVFLEEGELPRTDFSGPSPIPAHQPACTNQAPMCSTPPTAPLVASHLCKNYLVIFFL